MKYKELLKQPVGTLFCEVDLPSTPLFILTNKVFSIEDNYVKITDIIIEPLFHNEDMCGFSYGFKDMDESDKNSKEFYILTKEDKNNIINKLL